MTKRQRHEAFLVEYEALVRKHGVGVGSNDDTWTEDVAPEWLDRHIGALRDELPPHHEGDDRA